MPIPGRPGGGSPSTSDQVFTSFLSISSAAVYRPLPYEPAPVGPGSGSAFRSTLPLGNNGIFSRKTKYAGIIYAGKSFAKNIFNSCSTGGVAETKYAHRYLSPSFPSWANTFASLMSLCVSRRFSISPSSMRIAPDFHLEVHPAQEFDVAVGNRRAKSPVRYNFE